MRYRSRNLQQEKRRQKRQGRRESLGKKPCRTQRSADRSSGPTHVLLLFQLPMSANTAKVKGNSAPGAGAVVKFMTGE